MTTSELFQLFIAKLKAATTAVQCIDIKFQCLVETGQWPSLHGEPRSFYGPSPRENYRLPRRVSINTARPSLY